MKGFLLFVIVFNQNTCFSRVIFPFHDKHLYPKEDLINEINTLMGQNSAVRVVQNSSRVLLWTNKASVLERKVDGATTYEETTLPLFVPATRGNESYLRQVMEKQCECDLSHEEIAGVMIANPFIAAKMYFRRGWSNYSGDELDGKVPPAVIVYHEFAHVRDFILNEDWFFDMAASWNQQFKNLAEKSAVEAQNDFVHTLYAKRKIYPRLRRSYGKNELYKVSNPFEF